MKDGQEESRGTHRNDEATYHRSGRGWRRTPGFRIRRLIRAAILDVHRDRIITQSIAEGKRKTELRTKVRTKYTSRAIVERNSDRKLY